MAAASFDLPEDRHYDCEQHLWVQRDEGSGLVRIGLDAVAVESLGTLAYVALKDVGTVVSTGEPLGSLEAAKMTASLLAPVGGTVVELNEHVLEDPTGVAGNLYGEGWLLVLEPADWAGESGRLVGPDGVKDYHDREVERKRAEDAK